MQIKTVIAAALFSEAAMAAYTIKLYPKSGCKYDNILTKSGGYRCTNMSARQCCYKSGSTFSSAKFSESGKDTCDDEVKIYNAIGGDECGLPVAQATEGKCASHSSKDISGASVHVVINRKREVNGHLPMESVAATEFFYENGTVTHVLNLRSPEGMALELMERDEDKIEHVVRFGRRESNIESRAPKKSCNKRKPQQNPPARKPPTRKPPTKKIGGKA